MRFLQLLSFVFTALLYQCQGIQLTLDMTATLGSRPACGVLMCVEKSHDPTGTADVSRHLDTTGSGAPVRNVTKMAVYKMTGSRDQSMTGRESLVAAVDSQHATVTQVANAIKVDGSLGDAVTSIKLELFKQEDCQSGYICEVLAVDNAGRAVVKTSHLVHQPSTPSTSPGAAGGENWTPAVSMHLVNLINELNLNVELVKSAMEGYSRKMERIEDKVGSVEKQLTGKVDTLDKGVSNKLNKVDDNFIILRKELSDKLNFFERAVLDKFVSVDKEVYKLTLSNEAISDKLGSTAKRIEDKLSQQDGIIKALLQDSAAEVEKSFKGLVETVAEELQTKINTVYNNNSSAFERKVTTLSKDLQLYKNSTENQIQRISESLMTYLEKQASNLKQTCEKTAVNASLDIVTNANNRYDILEKNIDDMVKELVSSVNDSATETRSFLRKTLLSMNITNANDVASMVTEVLSPKTCKRGINSLAAQPPFPYPVIVSSPHVDVTAPYLCDTGTDGGGWIVIQRRSSGNVDFFRTWADYKAGFGSLDDEFWLGNQNIHALTSSGEFELRVELRYLGESKFAHYSKFAISDESDKYRLTLGAYRGTAGDSFSTHSGYPFTTRDQDNDSSSVNCAVANIGAWWYTNCHSSNLNGKWGDVASRGPRWSGLSGTNAVSFSEMKIRKLN